MSLLVFVGRRLALLVVTLFAVSVLIFTLTQVLPGDVATMILGMSATPEDLATLRRQMGLNRPAVVQYVDWLTAVLTGDLGVSTRFKQPVTALLGDRLWNSAKLAAVGLLFAIPSGVLLGVEAALRRGRLTDYALSAVALFGAAMPEFVTGAVMILLFSTWLGWFPPFSAIEAGMSAWEQLHRLVLPAVALNLVILAYVLRMMRVSMIQVMASPYVLAAALKGLPRRIVIVRHALPTALGPTLAVMALSLGWMFGGLVIVESMFGYPGLGRLLVFAMQNRDVPLLQAICLVVATGYALANLLADVLHRVLDPRTRDA
jgi:peptide/nickel transport system permease protein